MDDGLRLKTLLVDDDRNIRQTLSVSLRGLGCEVTVASSHDEAINLLRADAFDFVLTDFRLEGKSGIDLIRSARAIRPTPILVVMTAYASFDNAVEAIKEGAFDYLPKPFSNPQLAHVLNKVRTVVGLRRENEALRAGNGRPGYFSGMSSPAMMRLQEFVEKVAPTNATILMTGESGTGKSELARVVHEASPRAKQPFVVVNCTSLAETLLESELFGHVKGAFTGAVQDHVGKFELASHGTVFLDEIGDLSVGGQAKLLRVLQERVIERVGGNRSIPVDVRIIAATNRDLEAAVKEGRFREDLYFRLNVFECAVVPLRHRREDVPVLIERFLREFSSELRKLPEDVHQALISYAWPGNVRELRNVIERLAILSSGREARIEDLPESLRHGPQMTEERQGGLESLEAVERSQIEKVLSAEPNLQKAADILGITTVTLWKKRKQYGLP